jgi:hypothetical protein
LAGEVAETSPQTGQGQPSWRGWGLDRHLLASIFDAIQAQTVVIAKAAGAKNIKPPEPWPRPGKRSRGRSMAQVVSRHKQIVKAVNADGRQPRRS